MIDFAAENRRGYWGFTDGHQILRKMKTMGSSGIVMVMGLEEMGCKRNWKKGIEFIER